MRVLTCFLSLLTLLPAVGLAAPLVNAGLDADADANGLPDGWSRYCQPRSDSVAYSVDTKIHRSAPASLKMTITPGGRGTSSVLVPVKPGEEYAFRAWARTAFPGRGNAHVYIGWKDANRQPVGTNTHGNEATGTADWRPLVATGKAPEGAAFASLVLVAGIGEAGEVWFDDPEFLPAAEVPPTMTQREPGPLDVPIQPADGSSPLRNPPAFTWLPIQGAATYTLQLSPSPTFPSQSTQEITGIRLNLHNHPRTLKPGTWHWRYRAVSAAGVSSEWSPTRAFSLAPSATPFEVPTPADLGARVPASHPRLFANAGTLAAFRARRLGPAKEAWAALESEARRSIGRPLIPEPAPYPGGQWEVTQWRKIWADGAAAADQMERQAFAYLVSGDPAFAAEARRWMLHVCSWDPNGSTSHASNDMASRPIVTKMTRAYDWIYDTLSPTDRERIQATLRIRAGDLYRRLRAARLEARPFDSHLVSALEFMGEIALALYGDLPEAREWLEYSIPVHLALYPPWGGDDGGWSQGVSYWKWSFNSALLYADVLRSGLGIDVFQKPWYRATGFFKLYCHPPFARMSAFGDHSDGPPEATDATNMDRLGAIYGEGAFKWYAAQVPGRLGGVQAYLWQGDNTPPRPPADLPPSRLFADVGIAALHHRLWDPRNNITFLLKSSPYGSWNHGYAEQNNWVMDAFGEALVISSGYYPWYMSPHHKEWTHQTKAQNCILVNGQGQPIQRKDTVGRIAAFHAGEGYDYTVGDATPAYAGLLKRALRRVVYIRPGVFVMLDDAEAPEPASFQWMLHTLERIEVDEADRSALVRRGNARLRVQWLTPEKLTFSQTDKFPHRPEDREAHKPDQWHLTVDAPERTATRHFLTVLAPCRAGEETRLPRWAMLPATGGLAARAGEDLVGFRNADAPTVSAAGITTNGEAFALRRTPRGVLRAAFLAGGSTLAAGKQTVLSLPANSTGSFLIDGPALRAHLDLKAAGTVRLHLPAAPKTVRVDGTILPASKRHYDAKAALLTLRLTAGSHRVQVNPAPVTPLPPAPVVQVGQPSDVAPRTVSLNMMRAVEGALVAHGAVNIPRGPHRLSGTGGATVCVGGQPASEGAIVWPEGTTDLLVEAPAGKMPRALRLSPLPFDTEVKAAPVTALENPQAIVLEAETFSAQQGGKARSYTTRPFLSGGAGATEWRRSGHRIAWRVQVPKAGRYQLVVKAAVWEDGTRRLISWDGDRDTATLQPVAFPMTGGFGATPGEWSLLRAPLTFTLSAGEHVLTMTALSGPMNLDLLALVPQP